jgi:hypothetical protein
MTLPLAESDESTGSASSSTAAPQPRWISAANRCWKSVAATAAEPHSSRASWTRPPTQDWT